MKTFTPKTPLAVRCAASALPMLLAAPAMADLVSNGGFELPVIPGNFASHSSGSSMGAWTVSSGNVDHIHLFWAPAEGLQSLDLNGSGAGSISQTLTTVVGQQYVIRLAVSENFYGTADKTMQVLWGGAVVDTVTIVHDPARTSAAMGWSYRQVLVTATSTSTVLTLASTTGAMDGVQGFAAFYGPAVDDVSVNLAPPSCPADLNHDGIVDGADLGILLGAWGVVVTPTPADLNLDGIVDGADLGMLLGSWGPC